MPSQNAMIKDIATLSPEDTIEKALETLRETAYETAPVIDAEGRLLGIFSIQLLLKSLLPVSVPLSGGYQADLKMAAPGIAKRLGKIHYLTVNDLMDRKANVIGPATPLWEAAGLLVETSAPLFVIDPETSQVLGMITAQSVLDELHRQKDKE